MSEAAQTVETATARMNTSFSRVGPAWEEATHEAAFSTREAREAVRGLGEEIGVHMPRFVSSFVSDLGGVGPALAAAFTPIAVIGLAKVLYEAGKAAFEFYDNIVNLKKELEALDEIEAKLTDDMISLSNSIVKGNVKLAELSGGPIAGAKASVSTLGQEIMDLGKLMDVNGEQFKELGLAAKSSLREFLVPTQAADFADTLTRVGLEIKRVQSLLLNTEAGTTEYENLQEALSGLSAFYDVLALKVQRFNQEVQIAAAEQVKAEKEAADKAIKEADRKAKEAARLSHERAIAELNDLERVQKEEAKILAERAKENAEFDKGVLAEIKKKDEEIVKSGEKSLAEADTAQDKALAQDKQILKQREKPWNDLFNTIDRGMDQMVRGVFTGTLNIGQAFARMGGDIISSTAAWLTKVLAKHAEHWLLINVIEKNSMLQSLTDFITGTSAKQVANTGSNVAMITSDAGLAGAAAFTSVMAGLPFPANVATAPGVAAASVAAVLSNLTLASAEGGMKTVPSDMLALVHANESIIPADYASGLRNLVSGGGATQSAGAVHFQIGRAHV